jgi:outer membrane protein TolC
MACFAIFDTVAVAQESTRDLANMQAVIASVQSEPQSGVVTTKFAPGWWTNYVASPLEQSTPSSALTLEQVIVESLTHSKQISVFSELPLIRETAVIEASAAFDWSHYLDTRWDDISEPIGNALTAGAGVNRFNDHNWTGRSGLRRRTNTGGTLDVSQQFGFQDNNSQFFVPDPQGTSRLVIGFTQPLMRGRGRRYNESLVVLAKIDQAAAKDEFRRQTESHLLEVTRSYWTLYLERAALYQRVNLFLQSKEIADRLNLRANLDTSSVQIATANAAVASRESDLVRAKAAVFNAEARLRSLVNSPALEDVEVLPLDLPSFESTSVEMKESIAIAMQCRPELLQSLKQIKAASVRLNMSKNELMPVLNLVTETYASGLSARGNSLNAFARQFDTGAPSYGIGLVYERPIGNRAAEARLRRRKLELRQINQQYSSTLETIRYEVFVAVQELRTSLNELATKQLALEAQNQQLQAMSSRWKQMPKQQSSASLALENLLQTQQAVANAEFDYLSSQLTYNLSLVNLKRATGTLLRSEQIDTTRLNHCGVPQNVLSKSYAVGTNATDDLESGGFSDGHGIVDAEIINREFIRHHVPQVDDYQRGSAPPSELVPAVVETSEP